MTPETLIQQVATGNKQAFAALYEIFKDRVFHTTLSYLQDTEDAEETAQDVFVEVFRSAGQFGGQSTVSTWIYRITVNKCLDKLRYRKRKKRISFLLRLSQDPSQDVPHFEHPGVLAENKEKSSLLFHAISRLPAQQKSAYILFCIEELSGKEVAEVMRLSPKAVESLVQRARQNLRKILEKYYPERGKSPNKSSN